MSREKHDNTVFYEAQDKWIETRRLENWQVMFREINSACLSRMKLLTQKVPGKHFDDLDERALDAAIIIMERIKRHSDEGRFSRIENLSNFVFFPCYGVFFGRKQRDIDSTVCFSDLSDEQKAYEEYWR